MTSRRGASVFVLAPLLSVALASAACSGSDSSTVNAQPGADAGATTADGAPAADAAPPPDDTGVPTPSACPSVKHKTLVVIGDSISDVGGGGDAAELPFYRTVLVANDDAKYPSWKGFDLATCDGLDPSANVVKASKGGAIATVPDPNTTSNKGILLNQVTALPTSLPGPVLVVGTIGGNDVTRGLRNVILGSPAQQQADVDAFVAGFGAAMAELAKPDRFGPGVKVDVLMTNIYDPSGGSGRFFYAPANETCPGGLGLWPEGQSTAEPLAKWNTAMAAEAAKYPIVKLLEMYTPFVKHAVHTPAEENWFFKDCIHPSSAGHHAVRGIFWQGLVGLK